MRIEANIIAAIGAHPNIVQLMGVTTDCTGANAPPRRPTHAAILIRNLKLWDLFNHQVKASARLTRILHRPPLLGQC